MKYLGRGLFYLMLFVGVFLGSCGENADLKTGVWRGVLWVEDEEVPFKFEIGKSGGKTFFVVFNGARRDTFQVASVGGDSLHIYPDTFEYRLFAKRQSDGVLTGEYRNLAPGNVSRILPFEARSGQEYRFVEPGSEKDPGRDISGTWELTIAEREGDAAKRVAVFSQKKNRLDGIILSITGDSRELEGNISGREFWLSGFSGSGATLVKGTVDEDGNLIGTIGFGEKALHFTGERNDEASLADAYNITHLKPGFSKLELRLPNLKGDTISLDDENYRGKVVVIDILGSWCPNCIDQIGFLSDWYKANKDRGVEVIGVAFEVKDDLVFARRVLGKVVERFDIGYEILFGGTTDSGNVRAKFPALDTFLAFPTTIVVGRDGTVKTIHTGFSGKGTGKFYDDFVEKWNRDMDNWLAEPDI